MGHGDGMPPMGNEVGHQPPCGDRVLTMLYRMLGDAVPVVWSGVVDFEVMSGVSNSLYK